MKSVYVVVDPITHESLSVPTFERDLARGYLQTIKQSGVKDAIILAAKLDRDAAKRIR